MSDFPFPMPEHPRPAMTGLNQEAFKRYSEVLTWFVDHRGGKAPPPGAPVWRWIESLRRCAAGLETMDVEGHTRVVGGEVESPRTIAAVCDFYAATAAAHAIQIIEAQAAAGMIKLDVHGSFTTDELGARDHSDLSLPALPAGIGTLLLAAEAAFVGGGELCIFGNKSKGLDVEWRVDGSKLRFEAKSRAFAAAFAPSTSCTEVWKWAAGQVVKAGPQLRTRSRFDGSDSALQVIRLTAFLPAAVAEDAADRERWLRTLTMWLKSTKPSDTPHAVLVHWIGIDVEHVGGGLRSVADSRPHSVWLASSTPRPNVRARRKLGDMVGNPAFAL